MSETAVLGSIDVEELYPSLDIDSTVEMVCQTFEESTIQFEGVNYAELGLYIALNNDAREMEGKGLSRVCPTRRNNSGRKPKITASGIRAQRRDRFAPWIEATQQPDEGQKRMMLTEAIRIALNVIMKNHIYEYNQVLRRQSRGGPIGMDLTGTVAKIFMKWWDKQLLQRMDEVGIAVPMYERYVDDGNICAEATQPGVRYERGVERGRLVESHRRAATEEDEPPDIRTFRVIQDIGNSIHHSIQVKIDVPSMNTDKKLPILNLKTWMRTIELEGRMRRKIVYEHYIKDVASKYVIQRDSAMAISAKRTILTQMCLRAMLNCSHYLGWATRKEHVEYFMKRMQASGYDEADWKS